MSPAVLPFAATPIAEPVRAGRPDARPDGDPEAFETMLDRSTAGDALVEAASPSTRVRSGAADPDGASAESAPSDVVPAAAQPVAEVASPPLVPPLSAPVTSVPPSPGVDTEGATVSLAPEPPSAATEPAMVETTATPPASVPAGPALAASMGQASAAAQATSSRIPTPPSASDRGTPRTGDEPTDPAEPAGASDPKVVAPVASDQAREIAAVRSAVVAPTRPNKATAQPAQPAASGGTEPDVLTEPTAEGAADAAVPVAAAAGRVREVIERAVARESQGQPQVKGSADAPAAPRPDAAAVAPDKLTAPTAPPPRLEPPTAVDALQTAVPVAEAEAAALPAPVATAQIEARVDAAVGLGLSTLSRASLETTAQIAAQIVRKLEGRSTRFEMALTPEDLGRVDVSLDIDADGSIAARLAFDNPVAATELRGRVDELRRQLQEAGFTVAEDALSFAERDPSSPGQGGAFDRPSDRRAGRAFGAASRVAADADLVGAPRWIPLTLTPDRVDMKV